MAPSSNSPSAPEPRATTTPRPKRATTQPKSAAPQARQIEKTTQPVVGSSSEPSKNKQKLKYIPGGPGGGGRYVDPDTGLEIPVGGTGPGGYNYIGPRGRVGRENLANGVVPQVYSPRRDRSTRTRPTTTRTHTQTSTTPTTMRYSSSSAAQAAAAAAQSESYKPREERSWEEFHPDLNIYSRFMAFDADELDGIVPSTTPNLPAADSASNGSGQDADTDKSQSTPGSANGESPTSILIPGMPGTKRRPGRPPKNPAAFFAARALAQSAAKASDSPQTPKYKISNVNPKEKLTLPQPSYRKSDTLARFEDKALGHERYVDQAMQNVGYQITDIYQRPATLIRASDSHIDENAPFRVEYDMDEHDEVWLREYNERRCGENKVEPISREIFEITITKIEIEWDKLQKRIPKPNSRAPQTHRPRSSSAAAVSGEPAPGEELDSLCAICDDGDCENTNAIVFCDGCDLAVHQECYGVPFIPEGQWLCRKCLLVGNGIPTCIFCPNTEGAFKQTNASKWAHLLCAMWIPEVSLGNHSFMEPILEVESVPKTRWKLTCYICQHKMGACIQCGNKSCYQAFHVTCARKARLCLKMKNSHGTLAVLDETAVLKAFCDKHCPPDHAKEHNVAVAIREAQRFYKKTMRGRIWADNQATATALAARDRHPPPKNRQLDDPRHVAKVAESSGQDGKIETPHKPIWKLPSGAPIIPRYILDIVDTFLQRFNVHKRREWAIEATMFWTLKIETRRGARLIKRLQLQGDSFSSADITRRNYEAMGPIGRERLERRLEFSEKVLVDLQRLKVLSDRMKEREHLKLQRAKVDRDIMDIMYFPIASLLPPILSDAKRLDEKRLVFPEGFARLEERLENRFYTDVMAFAIDFAQVISAVFVEPKLDETGGDKEELSSPAKKLAAEMKEIKKHAKRIMKQATFPLGDAIRAETDITHKNVGDMLKELEIVIASACEPPVIITESTSGNGEAMEVDVPEVNKVDVTASSTTAAAEAEAVGDVGQEKPTHANGKTNSTPPDSSGYVSAPEVPEVRQPPPPTPPVSTDEMAIDNDSLANGGLPWYLRDLDPQGIDVAEEKLLSRDELSDDLSEIDEEELNGLGAAMEGVETSATALAPAPASAPTSTPAARNKKGKAKKRRRGSRW